MQQKENDRVIYDVPRKIIYNHVPTKNIPNENVHNSEYLKLNFDFKEAQVLHTGVSDKTIIKPKVIEEEKYTKLNLNGFDVEIVEFHPENFSLNGSNNYASDEFNNDIILSVRQILALLLCNILFLIFIFLTGLTVAFLLEKFLDVCFLVNFCVNLGMTRRPIQNMTYLLYTKNI